jgi:serine/threonine-protein kinase
VAATLTAVPVVVLTPGSASAKALGLAALVVLSLVFGGVIIKAKKSTQEPPTPHRFVGPLGIFLGTAAGVTLNYAFGLFTPLPFTGLLGLLIIYLGVGSSELEARYLFIASSLAYAVAIGLSIAGVLPEIGLLEVGSHDRRTMLLCLAGHQIGLGLSYVFARTTGQIGRQLLHRLDRAVREATRREALLLEARAELRQAAGVGAGGLFTELELGSFVLGDVIGRGGMGEVYEATHKLDGSRAAVKLLRRDVMSDPSAVRRFEQEARIVSELQSEHVVRIREVGGLDAPLPYIAMELLHGDDLAGLLRERGRLRMEEVRDLLTECCRGLKAAHERGIVHRDLKPQNLFLHADEGGRERWKILDFGVSKLLSGRELSLPSERVIGTPTYMAPEQALGRAQVDARADLYALCVVAYRALTGSPAFASGPPALVLKAVLESMPPDPARLATLPADVIAALRIGLAKDPGERFESASALDLAFSAACEGRLDEALRQRASRLLAEQAWGADAPLAARALHSQRSEDVNPAS